MSSNLQKSFVILLLFSFFSVSFAQNSSENIILSPIAKRIIKQLDEKNLLPKDLGEIVVIGGIPNPKIFRKEKRNKLAEVIAMVGGLPLDSQKKVLIIRKVKDSYSLDFSVNVSNIIRGKKNDFELIDGDIVIIFKKTNKTKDPRKIFESTNIKSSHPKIVY